MIELAHQRAAPLLEQVPSLTASRVAALRASNSLLVGLTGAMHDMVDPRRPRDYGSESRSEPRERPTVRGKGTSCSGGTA